MIYQIIIPESVYEELNDASLYYESKQKGLGVKFVLDWEESMNQLKKSPQLFQKKHKQLRSIHLNRFPYFIIFEVEDNSIYVYRLIQDRRNPKRVFRK